ncbi:MAG: T9SS type A sorting domain-containing protein [Flavobacteriales bacterium]|nr:T9SS type A sorting domain-containing protein [Flavobacteriales bacterium]
MVTLTVSNACGSNTSVINAGTIFFGVEEEEALHFGIYPNPGSDQFTVRFEQAGVEGVLEVRNLLGQVLHTQPLNGTATVNISANWPAGNYFVLVKAQNAVFAERLSVIK